MQLVGERKKQDSAPDGKSAQVMRAAWMGLLARAELAELRDLAASVLPQDGVEWLRAPETGMAMLRAQTGAGGVQFHLAEITVTRCSVRLEGGPVGHAYVKGRSHDHARIAALCDALLQMPDRRAEMDRAVIEPLRASEARRRAAMAAEAGRTRVEFFTLAREV